MKGQFTIACSVAMLGFFLASHAQNLDPAIARVDDRTTKNPSKTALEKPASAKEEKLEANTRFVVPANTAERGSAQWILDHKAGPNGEDLQHEDNKFYYIDEAGKRVEISAADLKDKPKSSL